MLALADPRPAPSPMACLHCGGPFPSTRCTVTRKYCSDHCRRRAFQLASPDRERQAQQKYRRRLRTTGQTPWHKLTTSAWVDAQLARTDGVPQRAVCCGHCRRELAVLVGAVDGQRYLLVGGTSRVVVALDPSTRDVLRVECPRCQVFRAIAQRTALVPAVSATAAGA